MHIGGKGLVRLGGIKIKMDGAGLSGIEAEKQKQK